MKVLEKVTGRVAVVERVLKVLVSGLLCLPLLAGLAFAAGPEWSSGFPKLSEKNALLQWNPVKGASEYKIYRGEEKGTINKLIATVKTNRHIDKGLADGKTFYYQVAAVAGGKEGERSPAASVKTEKKKVYVPIKVPRLMEGHVKDQPGGAVSVGLRWEGSEGTDLVGINVYRSKVKGKDYILAGSSQSDEFTDTDVSRGETYYYAVTAVDNQFKETKYSNEIIVKIPAPAAAEAAKEAEAPEAGKVLPTEMKKARFLFAIPRRPFTEKEKTQNPMLEELLPKLALDVKVDEAVGHIYVAAYFYGGVLVYNMDGELQFGIRKDGVSGKEKFKAIQNLAVGENGNLYVADYSSPEVYVFDFTGKPVEKIKVDISHIKDTVAKEANIYGVVVGKNGTLYLGDPATNRIHVYNSSRKRLFDIDQNKKGDKVDYNGPSYMLIDKDGDLVFVDAGFSRLKVYGPDGGFKRDISRMGTGAGTLEFPTGIANGNDGEIYAASGTTPNIQAFSTDGKFLYALCNEKCDGPIGVAQIKGIYIDKKNRLYISEGMMNRVSVYQLMEGVEHIIPK